MPDFRTCDHCKCRFIYNHATYKPKFKFVSQPDGPPVTEIYCSDACLLGLDPSIQDEEEHNIRTMSLTGKLNEKWVCLGCMEVMGREDLEKTTVRKEEEASENINPARGS